MVSAALGREIRFPVRSAGRQLRTETVDPVQTISSSRLSVYEEISVSYVYGASVLCFLSVQEEPFSSPDYNHSYLTRHCQCNTLNAHQ